MVDTFVDRPTFAEYLAPNRIDTQYTHDEAERNVVLGLIADAAYSAYMTSEGDFSTGLFAAATDSAQQGRRFDIDATPYVEPLDVYRDAKLSYVDQHGPHLVRVNATTGEVESKPTGYAQLARFQDGNERPNFAPTVYTQPYRGDQIAQPRTFEQPSSLSVLLAAWRCRNEWSGVASEWISKQTDKLRARVGIGSIALAD